MSDARPSKVNQVLPSDMTASLSGGIQKAQDTVETARDLIARAHQAIDTTRQTMASRDEILQHHRAWRERQAEQPASHARSVPYEAGINILLITDSAGDIARFCYALKEYALLGPMKCLTERSDVEAFVHKAATTAPLFLPRLIITECQLPSMELEVIVAAMHTVPAYEGIPILLFSALDEAEGQRRCLQCGATAFVHKPRNWEALLNAVATMVHRWGGGEDRQHPSPDREENSEEENDFSRNSSS